MDSARMAEAGHCAGSPCAATPPHARGTALLLYPARIAKPRPGHAPSPAGVAAAVERGLPKGWRVIAVVPDEAELRPAVETAIRHGSDRLVAVSVRPQFDSAFARPALQALYRCLAALGADLHVETRPSWHDECQYVDALAGAVIAAAAARQVDVLEAEVTFCLRGGAADAGLIEAAGRTAELVMARIGRDDGAPVSVCVVDAEGVLHWPQGLPRAGRPILLCPLDPFEDPARLASQVLEHGVARPADLHTCEPMGPGEGLVKSLIQIVRRGRQPAARPPARTLVRRPVDRKELFDGLFMVGTSVAGAIAVELGRDERHCTREQLLRVKRPHLETLELLRDVARRYPVAECWIWNTCSRFEVYGWLSPDITPDEAEAAMSRLAAEVGHGTDVRPAVLRGRDAWAHVMRTALGINSGLVGDADVLDQFDASLRAARHAGTAHERCREASELVEGAVRAARGGTTWGTFMRRYCDTALSLMPDEVRGLLARGKVVIVGGSTTSASSLESLRERFGARLSNLTLYYRGHRVGPLMDRLVRAVGHERLVCIDSYHDPVVTRAVAEADVAILAADQREPFLQAAALADGDRSPVLIDFNNFGSVAGTAGGGQRLFDADCIEACIRELNHRTCASAEFDRAYHEAEAWIERWLEASFGSPRPAEPARRPRQGVLA